MTSLSIYVEKWYIVGAVCVDNVPHVIKLPNNEDRIWLYFYEDIVNDNIYYGKVNKKPAQNKENHYIDDVFSKIVESDATFRQFGHDCRMSEIFKYSGIFDVLKEAFHEFSGEKTVPIYVAFSQDISYDAQNIFKEELESNDFEIKQFAGKIDFLALEWANRKGLVNVHSGKYALVMRSTNENLHMSLFKTDGNIFVEMNKAVLDGYGNDVRRHAVIEKVIDQGNSALHFLTQEEEFKHERLRFEEFVDEWIIRLDNGRPGIPVRISDVAFSVAPNNKFSANLRSKEIDDRTQMIIRRIVDYIREFITVQNNIREYELDAVILLGNAFGNTQYFTALNNWLQIGHDRIIRITESQLPDIVGVYSQIDSAYFSTEENIFATQAELERQRQEKFEEEERNRLEAEQRARETRQSDEAKAQAERKYKDAMDQAYEADAKKDYSNMRKFLEIALDAKPNDAIATNLLERLKEVEIEEKLKSDQYRAAINNAEQALAAGNYDVAITYFSQATTIDPSSTHAKNKLAEIQKIKSDKAEADKCIVTASIYEAQGMIDKALTELQMAKLLDPDNAQVQSKISLLETSINEKNKKINSLALDVRNSSDDIETAISSCEELVVLDVDNKEKWKRTLETLKSRLQEQIRREAEEAEKSRQLEAKIEDYRKKVEDAASDGKWEEVSKYCAEALTFNVKDQFFQRYSVTAAKEIAKKAINKTVKIFDDFFGSPKKEIPTTQNKAEGSQKNREDDFFGSGSSSSSSPKSPVTKKKDDFFNF